MENKLRRLVSVVAVSIVICVAVAVYAPVADQGNNGAAVAEIALLREQYPQYFDLDTSQGLDVYVWNMAAGKWSFCLLPHTEGQQELPFSRLINLMGTTAEEMRLILSAYDIKSTDVYIIPWQNPISSYIPEFWIVTGDESPEEKMAQIQEKVKKMLFEGQSG